MEYRKANYLVALGVFLVSAAVFVKTVSPTVVFWDVGEFCAAAFTLQVPHPPGAPLFLLIARLVCIVPYVHDIAVRMHLISAFASAATIFFVYLTIVRFVVMFRGTPESPYDRFLVFGSAAIGALSLAFNATFWFNAVEAEVYGLSMLFVASVIWLSLRWYERADTEGSDVYLLGIAYLMGLAVGVHLLAILALFFVLLMVYFRFYEFSFPSFAKFTVVAIIVFFVVYPGVVKWLPSMLDGEVNGVYSDVFTYIPIVLFVGAIYGIYYTQKKMLRYANVALLSFVLIVVGFSTYAMVYIRANAHPPMNENDPSTMARLVSYLNREQYGSSPLLKRRWDPDPEKKAIADQYSSDWDYFLRYQFYHMYLRYHLWNYVGVAGDEKDAGVNFNDFYAIPLIFGIIGALWHWRKQWQMAFVAGSLFIVMGLALVVYFNMQDPQPRERDYFYVGSYLIFSVWIGIGVLGVVDWLKERIASPQTAKAVGYGVVAFAFVFVPVNMCRVTYHQANRTGDYVPWDYSYNLLQSCEQDAILFTNGDNDTFPLWYLQDVEGIRTDIRIVNLSLVNTPWYIKQLKNEQPHGAKKVPISTSDAQIDRMQPFQYDPRIIELPVPKELVQQYTAEGTAKSLDTSITNSGVLRFLMPNTMEFGNVKALRVQDYMVYDIIRTNGWRRPIYFAMTVSDDGKIGLREYMRMTGLAFKLVPQRSQYWWSDLDDHAIAGHLFTDVKEPSKTPAFGFLWRGLQDSTTYYDEDTRKLITSNYRNLFLSLAVYYAQVLNQPQRASVVLDRMEQEVPRRVIPMDYRVAFDVSNYYRMAGNTERFKELSDVVIQQVKPLVDKGVAEPLNQFNPYLILFYAYANTGQRKEAEDLLGTIKATYGTQPGIDEFITSLRANIDTTKGANPATQGKPQ